MGWTATASGESFAKEQGRVTLIRSRQLNVQNVPRNPIPVKWISKNGVSEVRLCNQMLVNTKMEHDTRNG